MSDTDKQGHTPNLDPATQTGPSGEPAPAEQPAQQAGHTGAQPGAAQAQAPGQEKERTVHDVIAALQAEAADFKDKWLRAHAEIDNVRKRLEKEKEETAKYAITKLARDMVNVSDNFQRAVGAVPPGAADQDSALKSLVEGVMMTEREFLNILERYGIRRIDPANEPFNPHMHQAVMEMERADVAAGTVVQVFQAGYTIEDRVLRPAMVAVAKGGPKAQAAAPGAAPDTPAG